MPDTLPRPDPPAPSLNRVPSPWVVFLVVLVLVFVVEAIIMLTMKDWSARLNDPNLIATVDALLLTIILSPMLWFVIVRPLRRAVDQQAELLARAHDAQEEERARVARDLHDDLGQQLTALLVNIRAIDHAPTLEDARKQAAHVRDIAASAMNSTRRMARGLRTVDLADVGLVPMVERLCDEMLTPAGVRATVETDIPPGVRLAPAVESQLYRIIQEAITNCHRHAQATMTTVRLSLRGSRLALLIEDNGQGFDESAPREGKPSGMGLKGIRERVIMLGGDVAIRSTPGVGTAIRVTIPRVLSVHERDQGHDR